jgi:hypothetical protein
MRGLHEKGSKKGKVTKSGKKGTPWSQVWKREMGRCIGDGAGAMADIEEEGGVEELEEEEKREMAGQAMDAGEAGAVSEDSFKLKKLKCSPVTVIYGHAGELECTILPEGKLTSQRRGVSISSRTARA